MSAETHPLLSPHPVHNYSQQHDVSLDVRGEAVPNNSRRALPPELSVAASSFSSQPPSSPRSQPATPHLSPRRPPFRAAYRPVSLPELCSRCVLSFARFIGSSRWLWLTSSLYFLCHIAVSLYTLLTYFAEHCTYDYHYLLLVYCLRSLLALRIVWWQTQEEEVGAQQAVEPGTFDRFLKNWSLPSPQTYTEERAGGVV